MRLRLLLLSLMLLIVFPHIACSSEDKLDYYTEQYQQLSTRTDLTIQKIDSYKKSTQAKKLPGVSMALRKETLELMKEIGDFCNSVGTYNLSLIDAGIASNRKLTYMYEAGRAMSARLGLLNNFMAEGDETFYRISAAYGRIASELEKEFIK